MSYPAPYPYPMPRRTGSLGCLGVFAVFCLILFSLAELGALLWLNPDWFDRYAYWRGPRLEPDVVVDNSPETRRRLEEQDLIELRQVLGHEEPRRRVLFEFGRATAAYDPSSGAVIEGMCATLQLPPGAIGQATKVSLTPIIDLPDEMEGPLVGPVYNIHVGDREQAGHFPFRAPAEVTIPYDPKLDADCTIAFWDNGAWRPVRTRLDPQSGLATALIPHASDWTVIGKTLLAKWAALPPAARRAIGYPASAAAGVWIFSRGAVWGTMRRFMPRYDTSYETDNFLIVYAIGGEHACVSNQEYSGDENKGVPKYVQDIGKYLEEARAVMEKHGLPLPPKQIVSSQPVRYYVFLQDMGDCGQSGLNGPILLNRNLPGLAKKDGLDAQRLMRATAAHELMHVAQGEYMGVVTAALESQWGQSRNYVFAREAGWIESTAAYIGDWYGDASGTRTDIMPLRWGKTTGRVLTRPLEELQDPDHYAYACFFRWMDRAFSGDKGFRFVKKVNESKDASISFWDAASKEVLGKPIADVYSEFARNYYWDDLWEGRTHPTLHKEGQKLESQGWAQTAVLKGLNGDTDFLNVCRPVTSSSISINYYARGATTSLRPLTAHAAYLSIQKLPKKKRGKLVVYVNPIRRNTDLSVSIGSGRVYGAGYRPVLPLGSDKIELQAMDLASHASTGHVIPLKDGVNYVGLVAVNRSLTETAGGFEIERWLLTPPDSVQIEREGPAMTRQWKAKWERHDLADYPQVFEGYNVYRKQRGEPDESFTLVSAKVKDRFWIDTAPTQDDYVYTVRVVDRLGNESENADWIDTDPFAGEWEGEVTLVKGDIAKPLIAKLKQSLAESTAKEQAKINQVADSRQRQSQQQSLKEREQTASTMIEKIGQLMDIGEQLARVGIPMKMRLEREPGADRYHMWITEIAWNATDMKKEDGLVFLRSGVHSLRAAEQTSSLPPLVLSLVRMAPAAPKSEIRTDGYDIPPEEKSGFTGCTIKWHFVRESGTKPDEAGKEAP